MTGSAWSRGAGSVFMGFVVAGRCSQVAVLFPRAPAVDLTSFFVEQLQKLLQSGRLQPNSSAAGSALGLMIQFDRISFYKSSINPFMLYVTYLSFHLRLH